MSWGGSDHLRDIVEGAVRSEELGFFAVEVECR